VTVFNSAIEATIFYRHLPEEVRQLSEATIPLADQIRAVASSAECTKCKAILAGEYFRAKDAAALRIVCLRAARYARAHLEEYFVPMREQVIADAEKLEEATSAYWRAFTKLSSEVVPSK
jgi:hypothetical protein